MRRLWKFGEKVVAAAAPVLKGYPRGSEEWSSGMTVVRQLRRDLRKKESTYLAGYAKQVQSQHGEDGVLEKIFSLIGTKSKWCVEFGAWDGKLHSNSWNLIANEGWSSVQIEGNSARYAQLVKNHEGNQKVHCINAMVGFDPHVDSIEAIFQKTPIPRDFDFMSIDIDGNDYHIWASMGTYRPRVIMLEFNPDVPNDVVFIQERSFAVSQGSSLRAMVELGKRKGYELAAIVAANAIFVVKEDFPKLKIADNHIDSMYFAHREGRLFLLFDGTLVNCGLGELRLRQADPKPHTLDPFELQHYPAEIRGYGGRVPDAMLPNAEGGSTAPAKSPGDADGA